MGPGQLGRQDLPVGHRLVVVLAGVHEDLLGHLHERFADRGGLDDLRAGADHREHARLGGAEDRRGDMRGMVSSASSWTSGGGLVGEHRQSERSAATAQRASPPPRSPRRSRCPAPGSSAVPRRCGSRRAKSSSSRRSGSCGLHARDHDVAGAVDQLVLAEVGGRRRQHVHAAVVDPHRFVGGGVVVLDHPLAADDDHLADLARRQPGDLHVGASGPAAKVSVMKAVSGTPCATRCCRTPRPRTTGSSSQ